MSTVTFVAVCDKDTHRAYRLRAVELSLSNSEFFSYLLDIETKYSALVDNLGGFPKADEDGNLIVVSMHDSTARTFCTMEYGLEMKSYIPPVAKTEPRRIESSLNHDLMLCMRGKQNPSSNLVRAACIELLEYFRSCAFKAGVASGEEYFKEVTLPEPMPSDIKDMDPAAQKDLLWRASCEFDEFFAKCLKAAKKFCYEQGLSYAEHF